MPSTTLSIDHGAGKSDGFYTTRLVVAIYPDGLGVNRSHRNGTPVTADSDPDIPYLV